MKKQLGSYTMVTPNKMLDYLTSKGLSLSEKTGGSYKNLPFSFVEKLDDHLYDVVSSNRKSILVMDGSDLLEAIKLSSIELDLPLFV